MIGTITRAGAGWGKNGLNKINSNPPCYPDASPMYVSYIYTLLFCLHFLFFFMFFCQRYESWSEDFLFHMLLACDTTIASKVL